MLEITFSKQSTQTQNEALAIIVDAETYYLDEDGKFYILSVIAHELTRAANFYQRFVLMSNSD